jgi:hypothetical protein
MELQLGMDIVQFARAINALCQFSILLRLSLGNLGSLLQNTVKQSREYYMQV